MVDGKRIIVKDLRREKDKIRNSKKEDSAPAPVDRKTNTTAIYDPI